MARQGKAAKAAPPASPPEGPATVRTWFLLATVFLTGAAVMVLEVLGARVLAPIFGQSLFVWTAVISVTLLALAGGYQVGGQVADRWPQASVLFRIILLAAFWVGGLTWLKAPALDWLSHLGERSGPLAGCTLLFFVPLFGLAMVGPFVVRLATREVGHVGSIVGRVTALSTIGSVAGTIATGFVLIPEVGVDRTLIGVAGGLLGIAVAGRWLLGAKGGAAGAAVLGGLVLLPALAPAKDLPLDLGNGIVLLEERSSPYAELKVADVDGSLGRMRWMFIGQAPQTIRFLEERSDRPPYYVDALHYVEGFHPDPRRYLVIGLGGGTLSDLVAAKPGVEAVDVVEIDQDVVELARRHFDFVEEPPVRVHVQDGRYFVRHVAQAGSYDVLFFDVFGAGTAPYHLFTVEAVAEMKRVLAGNGLFVMNYLGFSAPGEREAIDSVLATIGSVFRHVRVVLGEKPNAKLHGWANYLILASDEPVRLVRHPFRYLTEPLHRNLVAGFVGIHHRFRGDAGSLPSTPEDLALLPIDRLDAVLDVTSSFDPSAGRVVTDDVNWLEVAHARQNEIHREEILSLYRRVFVR